MGWLSWIFPRVILKEHSRYNADILVVERNNKLSLLVNGIQQTGMYVETLFHRAFQRFVKWYPSGVKRILVIGVGGGSVIQQLKDLYPEARIVAVDVDKVIVHIAKKYFNVKENSMCSFVVADARSYLSKKNKPEFDLIIIDIYIGNDVPTFVTSKDFVREVRRALRPGGRMLMNYFSYHNQPKKSEELLKKLSTFYSVVEMRSILRNKVYFASTVLK
jgi:spermidine synthase